MAPTRAWATLEAMSLFLTIALVHIVALITPGPDFFFVSQLAASRSRREALAGVVGIALGVAVWAALALLGLHVLLQRLVAAPTTTNLWQLQLVAVFLGLGRTLAVLGVDQSCAIDV